MTLYQYYGITSTTQILFNADVPPSPTAPQWDIIETAIDLDFVVVLFWLNL